MKYTAISLMVLLLFGCGDSETYEVGNKTSIEITPQVFDAGDVILGEKVSAKFTITNTGDYPLVISDVTGSCSCTVADKPDKPIPPGKTGVVRAYVNTTATGVGALNKAVNIVANTEPSVTTVVVRAAVMKK